MMLGWLSLRGKLGGVLHREPRFAPPAIKKVTPSLCNAVVDLFLVWIRVGGIIIDPWGCAFLETLMRTAELTLETVHGTCRQPVVRACLVMAFQDRVCQALMIARAERHPTPAEEKS